MDSNTKNNKVNRVQGKFAAADAATATKQQ